MIRKYRGNVNQKTIIFVFVYIQMLSDFIKMPLFVTIFLTQTTCYKNLYNNYLLTFWIFVSSVRYLSLRPERSQQFYSHSMLIKETLCFQAITLEASLQEKNVQEDLVRLVCTSNAMQQVCSRRNPTCTSSVRRTETTMQIHPPFIVLIYSLQV